MHIQKASYFLLERIIIMSHHLSPLEKELLIKEYQANPNVGLKEFCIAHNLLRCTFQSWLVRYEKYGLQGLYRFNTASGSVLPPDKERTKEEYEKEIMRLRIENERLKKNYTVRRNSNGELEYQVLRPKSSK